MALGGGLVGQNNINNNKISSKSILSSENIEMENFVLVLGVHNEWVRIEGRSKKTILGTSSRSVTPYFLFAPHRMPMVKP